MWGSGRRGGKAGRGAQRGEGDSGSVEEQPGLIVAKDALQDTECDAGDEVGDVLLTAGRGHGVDEGDGGLLIGEVGAVVARGREAAVARCERGEFEGTSPGLDANGHSLVLFVSRAGERGIDSGKGFCGMRHGIFSWRDFFDGSMLRPKEGILCKFESRNCRPERRAQVRDRIGVVWRGGGERSAEGG